MGIIIGILLYGDLLLDDATNIFIGTTEYTLVTKCFGSSFLCPWKK